MKKRKWPRILWCVLAALLLAGCTLPAPTIESPPPPPASTPISTQAAQPPASPAPEQTPEQEQPAFPISAWAVYWDTEGALKELELYGHLEALCYFEAYFNHQGQLVLPDALPRLYAAVQELYPDAGWTSYLTFVNDLQEEHGAFSLKDTGLLWTLLGTEEAMRAHVEDVIALTKAQGFAGVEIDYEAIRGDLPLWERFIGFCEALYARTQEEGLKLRVVLEPVSPFERLSFPSGPTYVVMCYNLHGGHSGPGPKADADFLCRLAEQVRSLPGRREFALATGGYDWAGGSVRQLTEAAALALAQGDGVVSSRREEASQAMVLRYVDEAGTPHEVWYADQTTLDYWAGVLREEGCEGLSVWRLGGSLAVVK